MLKAILVCMYLCIPHISADVLPWVLKETQDYIQMFGYFFGQKVPSFHPELGEVPNF